MSENALIAIRFAQADGEVDVSLEAAIKGPFGDHFQVDCVVDNAYGEVMEDLGIVLAFARLENNVGL